MNKDKNKTNATKSHYLKEKKSKFDKYPKENIIYKTQTDSLSNNLKKKNKFIQFSN